MSCLRWLGRLLWKLILQASLVVAVLAVFSELFAEEKVFDMGDDLPNYQDNKLLRPVKPGEWGQRAKEIMASKGAIGVWEPPALLFKAAITQHFGLRARTFTGAAACLHGITVALAMELCLAVERHLAAEPGPGSLLHAWAAALLLGLHPLRAEPLSWASGLPYELATLAAVLAALCHLRHKARLYKGGAWARPLGLWRILAAALVLLACTCKAAALGLGPALVLLDMLMAWEGRGAGIAAILADNFLMAAATLAATIPAWKATEGGDAECKFAFQWWQRLLRAAYMSALYLVQQFWPRNLCVLHAVPLEDVALDSWQFGGAALALGLGFLICLYAGARATFVAVAYIALLAPTLGVLTDHIAETAADRYCHICCMMLGTPLLACVLRRLHPRLGLISVGAILGVAACEGMATHGYVKLWVSPETTIQQSVTASPRFYRTQYIYAIHLLHKNEPALALKHFQAAVALCWNFTNTHFGLMQSYLNQGMLPEAAEAMRGGIKVAPKNYMGHLNLGVILHRDGKHKEAIESLKRALVLEPKDNSARGMLQQAQMALARSQQQALGKSAPGQGSAKKVTTTKQVITTKKAQAPPKASSPTPPSTSKAPSTSKVSTSKQAPSAPKQEAAVPTTSRAPTMTAKAVVGKDVKGQSPELAAREGKAEEKHGLADEVCPAAAAKPYLSLVLASRNDDYAGSLEERFIAHVALMQHQLRKAKLHDSEVLVVEWNPPSDRPGLKAFVDEGLLLGRNAEGITCVGPALRLLTVDPSVHRSLQEAKNLGPAPMAEYFAKNLGIRSARGEFVLAMNPDIVLSPALVGFLAMRTLRSDSFYTTGMRFDMQWPKRFKAPAKYLKTLMRRAQDDSLLEGEYASTSGYRPEAYEPARTAFGHICAKGDDGKGQISGYWDFHAGDFVVAAKSAWEKVAGYPELNWTFGVDSAILCKFFGRGLRNVALLPPCFAVHQHHRIRENPNARRVVDPSQLCEQCKKNPRGRLDPLQREPRLWGNFEARFITKVEL